MSQYYTKLKFIIFIPLNNYDFRLELRLFFKSNLAERSFDLRTSGLGPSTLPLLHSASYTITNSRGTLKIWMMK